MVAPPSQAPGPWSRRWRAAATQLHSAQNRVFKRDSAWILQSRRSNRPQSSPSHLWPPPQMSQGPISPPLISISRSLPENRPSRSDQRGHHPPSLSTLGFAAAVVTALVVPSFELALCVAGKHWKRPLFALHSRNVVSFVEIASNQLPSPVPPSEPSYRNSRNPGTGAILLCCFNSFFLVRFFF